MIFFKTKMGLGIYFQISRNFSFSLLIATKRMISRTEVRVYPIVVRKFLHHGRQKFHGFLCLTQPQISAGQIVPPGGVIFVWLTLKFSDSFVERNLINLLSVLPQNHFRNVGAFFLLLRKCV